LQHVWRSAEPDPATTGWRHGPQRHDYRPVILPGYSVPVERRLWTEEPRTTNDSTVRLFDSDSTERISLKSFPQTAAYRWTGTSLRFRSSRYLAGLIQPPVENPHVWRCRWIARYFRIDSERQYR